MENQRLYLQGLDYRSNDREAPPGVCRVLSDLYPAGDTERPSWAPVSNRELFYEDPAGKILGVYLWARTNARTTIVYLLHSAPNGNPVDDTIVMRDVDANIVPVGDSRVLYTLKDYRDAREISFAQIGDTLIMSIVDGETLDELIVASTSGLDTICSPYNLPDTPRVLPPDSYQASKILWPSAVLVGYYFGFRFGWELIDGTIAKISGVSIRMANREFAGSVTVTTSKMTVSPELNATQEAATFFGDSSFCRLGEELPADHPYKDVIKGIAILISEPKLTIEDVLENAVYYRYGTITDVFGTNPPAVNVKFLIDDLITLPVFEEDALTSHDVYAATIASYNKMLLLAGVAYDYQLPKNPGAELTTGYSVKPGPVFDTPRPYYDPLLDNGVTTGEFVKVTWQTVGYVPKETVIEVNDKTSGDDNWVPVEHDQPNECLVSYDELLYGYAGVRGMNYYIDGSTSRWTINETIPERR